MQEWKTYTHYAWKYIGAYTHAYTHTRTDKQKEHSSKYAFSHSYSSYSRSWANSRISFPHQKLLLYGMSGILHIHVEIVFHA